MIEREEGTVMRIDGPHAWVVPDTVSACDECSLCARTSTNEIRMANPVRAAAGDRVRFALDIDALNRRFIFILLFALCLVIAGAFGGHAAAPSLGLTPEIATLAGAAFAVIAAVFLTRMFQPGPSKALEPTIVEIVKEEP
ncbi:MAG TPA: SoxR reducing system RseC family protein [Thermoanaerobaculia bacterium]|nr:SoxR reducing system RseC family protein [Thermoanaerobaculia bacterium]HUM28974.1 SoxR reducing system RseC family protein [Thermoanaerobaculia bacterium]HXK67094.1 SoxR reducing system RseC family protein [Thermoanaerobaculia bacterium]